MSTRVNGFNLSGIIATAEEPKGERRDVGSTAPAVDGTTRVTRQTRKRDLAFRSVPLTAAQSLLWESFLIGEGEVWSFDVSTYGSKGTSPSAATDASIVTSSPKFGASNLQLKSGTGTITYSGVTANLFGRTTEWTVCVWRFESGAWHPYGVRSDGTKWLDGIVNGGATTTWLTVSGGNVTIANTSGSPVNYDDLIVFPFKVDNSWPAVIAAATAAFPPLPYLDLSGDFVGEQASRRVLGTVDDTIIKTAAGFRHKLNVKLVAR